jgi:hypothetical protein
MDLRTLFGEWEQWLEVWLEARFRVVQGELGSWKSIVWFDAALMAGAVACVVGVRLLHDVDRKERIWKL